MTDRITRSMPPPATSPLTDYEEAANAPQGSNHPASAAVTEASLHRSDGGPPDGATEPLQRREFATASPEARREEDARQVAWLQELHHRNLTRKRARAIERLEAGEDVDVPQELLDEYTAEPKRVRGDS
ncbi:hypothetical protein PWT90_09863 [Aphanocladium album]|nr:hypothetical protein PWT90_09863 [Aphanocladium album]